MTAAEKRTAVVNAIKSREGKNTYTQDSRRTQVGSGYGDCSSTVQWCYKKIGINPGDYTEAQLLSKAGKDVALTITNGVPDESKILPGDILLFRGGSKVHASRTKNVGHVEMYVGNGQISGHPSGKGPTRKDLKTYCRQKQAQASSYATPKNCGLICVRRFIPDDGSGAGTAATGPITAVGSVTKGMQVQFRGTRHYTSSDGAKYSTCSPCTATVTAIAKGAKYPYHVVGNSVHGWVAASDIGVNRAGTVICTSLHIRQRADKTSASLGIMKNGDQITITGEPVNGWYPIIWKGKAGYAKQSSAYIRVA